jgi:hypothetical protein
MVGNKVHESEKIYGAEKSGTSAEKNLKNFELCIFYSDRIKKDKMGNVSGTQ